MQHNRYIYIYKKRMKSSVNKIIGVLKMIEQCLPDWLSLYKDIKEELIESTTEAAMEYLAEHISSKIKIFPINLLMKRMMKYIGHRIFRQLEHICHCIFTEIVKYLSKLKNDERHE